VSPGASIGLSRQIGILLDAQQNGALLLALMAASGIIWIWVGRQIRSGRQPLEYEPRASERRSLPAIAFTLLLIGYSAFSRLTSSSGEVTLELVKHNCAISLGITVFLALLLLLPRQSRLSDYGIRTAKLPEQIVIGAAGFLASYLPVFAVAVISAPWRSIETQHRYLTFVQANSGPTALAWILFAVAILAPISEELQYRPVADPRTLCHSRRRHCVQRRARFSRLGSARSAGAGAGICLLSQQQLPRGRHCSRPFQRAERLHFAGGFSTGA
jgi:hypothetical protein